MEDTKTKFGLNQVLGFTGLSKQTWYYRQNRPVDKLTKYQPAKTDLLKIIRRHPGYGYRRSTAELNQAYGYRLNHKVVRKLMKHQEIQLTGTARKPKPAVVSRLLVRLGDKMNLVAPWLAAGKSIGICRIVYTDFTELIYGHGRQTAQLMPVIDHASRAALGWTVGNTANTETAITAWQQAVETMKKLAYPINRVVIHHDRGSVYTGYDWLGQILLVSQAKVSYALRGAKDNPRMESFNSRFQAENQSLFWDCRTLAELVLVVNRQMKYYNTRRRHSSLGNKPPLTYLKERRKHR